MSGRFLLVDDNAADRSRCVDAGKLFYECDSRLFRSGGSGLRNCHCYGSCLLSRDFLHRQKGFGVCYVIITLKTCNYFIGSQKCENIFKKNEFIVRGMCKN